MTVIGDTPGVAVQPLVGSLTLSIVAQADVADIDSAVNDALVSGKKLGATYLMALTAGGTDIIVAQGAATNSDWDRISDAGAAPITPA